MGAVKEYYLEQQRRKNSNKAVLAEFMGLVYNGNGWLDLEDGHSVYQELNYDTSWDALIPVVQKIVTLCPVALQNKEERAAFNSMMGAYVTFNIQEVFDYATILVLRIQSHKG